MGSFRCPSKDIDSRVRHAYFLRGSGCAKGNAQASVGCRVLREVNRVLVVQVDNVKLWIDLMLGRHCNYDASKWIFRGQADAHWPLSSSLERLIGTSTWQTGLDEGLRKKEFEIIQEGKYALGINGANCVTNVFHLQHYGFPTRLIDFSDSPFVSLYFAADQKDELTSVAVWAINRDCPCFFENGLGHSPRQSCSSVEWAERVIFGDKSEGKIPSVMIITPPRTNIRMAAQSGLFLMATDISSTFMDALLNHADLSTHIQHNNHIDCKSENGGANLSTLVGDYVFGKNEIIKFVFDAKHLPEIREILNLFNVTPYSLTPDAEGFRDGIRLRFAHGCKHAILREVL